MLQAIRERITGWIAAVIVGLLIVTFALWGINTYLQREARVYAAEVNGQEISVAEYRRAYQNQMAQLRRMLGKDFSRLDIDEDALRKEVVERLVRQELLRQAAQDHDMIIGDGVLAARIRAIPQVQRDGEFSPELYQRLVAQQGMTQRQFEEQVRQSLLIGQLGSGISNTLALPESRLDAIIRMQAETREIAYVRIPASPERFPSEPDAAAIKTYFDAHAEDFRAPEQVRLSYVELDRKALAKDVKVSDEDVAARYAERKGQLAKEQERKVRHILIEVPADASPEAEAKAKAEAEELKQQLDKGADFAKIAREHSDDTGSAEAGGDLGYITRGALPQAFEDAVFQAEPGKVVGPVRTDFGYHLIEVTDVRQGETKPLADVADELRKEIAEQRAQSIYLEDYETLANLAYENPDSLQPAAEALDLKVKHPQGWLKRGELPEPFDTPEVADAIFSDDVLRQGYNSEVIELDDGRALVVRVDEYQPARARSLDEVRDEVVERLRRQHAREEAGRLGQEVLSAARTAGDLKGPAAEHDLKLEDPGEVHRGDPDVPPAILQQAYALPWPEGRPTWGGMTLEDGDYAVVMVDSVHVPDPKQAPEDQRKRFADELRQAYGGAQTTALIESLRAAAEIDIPKQSTE